MACSSSRSRSSTREGSSDKAGFADRQNRVASLDFAFQNCKAKGVRHGDGERAAGQQQPGERADCVLKILRVHQGPEKRRMEVKALLLELWKSLQGFKAALGKNEIRADHVPSPLLREAGAGVDTKHGCRAVLGEEARLVAGATAEHREHACR